MKRAPRPLAPTGVQLAYYQELRQLLRVARELVRERVHPRLEGWLAPLHGDAAHTEPDVLLWASLAGEARPRTDAPPSGINRIAEQLADAIWRRFPRRRLERIAVQVARGTDAHQREQLLRQFRALGTIDVSGIIDRGLKATVQQFVAENVALIRTLPVNYFASVERQVLRGVREGARASEIQTRLEDEHGVAQNRAALIARDQVLSFQADLNRVRMTELGVEQYVWRASPDERTREEHAERDGQTFRWDDPPGDPGDAHTGGHPGEAVLCRCWPDPVIPEDLLA